MLFCIGYIWRIRSRFSAHTGGGGGADLKVVEISRVAASQYVSK